MRYDALRAQRCSRTLQVDLALSFADNEAAIRLMEIEGRETRAEKERLGCREQLQRAQCAQEALCSALPIHPCPNPKPLVLADAEE